MATNPNPIQTQTQAPVQNSSDDSTQTQAAQTTPDTGNDSSVADESASAEGGVNLHKSFARLNESIAELYQDLGVKPSFVVPYISEQDTSEHVAIVGQVAQKTGGLTKNLLVSFHEKDKGGWGTGDGATIGYNADKLRETIIPKKFDDAIKAITVARRFLNQIENLLGDDPAVTKAKSQLNLVGKYEAQGMTALDLGIALQQIVHEPLKAVARAHSGAKDGGHSPKLRAPRGGAKK
ncbi:MAG: hypothetical protein WCA15_22810 [Candidatus Acidiferrales bacterium]